MINNMVELCFSECVVGFRSKALTAPEEKCISTCAEKFLKHSGRVGQRFGELCQIAQQAAPESRDGITHRRDTHAHLSSPSVWVWVRTGAKETRVSR